MDRDASPAWAEVMGDQGPWIRHLALAWPLTTSAAPHLDIPTDPTDALTADDQQPLPDQIAYWAPLAHLLIYGLGWRRPDLGLNRWRELGFGRKDPILDLVHRWWGEERIMDYLAWAAQHQPFLAVERKLAERLFFEPGQRRMPDDAELERRRGLPSWQQVWGGGWDSMHLTGHLTSPLEYPPGHDPIYVDRRWVESDDSRVVPRFTIISDTYAGWYLDLPHYGLQKGPNGRSIRTDVIVKPMGWLGEFRHHSDTGLWFRGRSHVHLLGQ